MFYFDRLRVLWLNISGTLTEDVRMPDKDAKSPLTEAEQKAFGDLTAFLQDKNSIIYLRLIDGIERVALVLANDNESSEGAVLQKQWLFLLHVDKDYPLRVLLYMGPSNVEVGRFFSLRECLQRLKNPALPTDAEPVIRAISKNGIIPLDGVVDWICERLISE